MIRPQTTHTACFAALAAAVLAAPATAQWELMWSDEFQRTELGPTYEALIGTGTAYGLPAGWGNNELQYYTDRPENVYVDGEMLRIVARAENYAGRSYTSARIRTQGTMEVLYGRIEARIKAPKVLGGWPAFWMMPDTEKYGIWAAGGEIDIMELANAADKLHGTIHFGGESPANTAAGGTYTTPLIPSFADDFHVYAVEWTPTQMRWYVDGVQFYAISNGFWFSANAPGNPVAPFDRPFHLILNVALGGNFPQTGPNGSAGLPVEMLVDWIRVYQAEGQVPSTIDTLPHPIPGTIQAEDYDQGGAGAAYFDDDTSNNGSAYRPTEGVDIEATSGGGFNVGWLRDDEWIEYTVDVQDAGPYEVTARVASDAGGGSFELQIDQVPVGPSIAVPHTDGWQNWTTVTGIVDLPAGEHVLRFENASANSEFNIDYLSFCATFVAGDADINGAVDVNDISYVLFRLGDSGAPGSVDGDANDDGTVDVNDISYVLFRLGNSGC